MRFKDVFSIIGPSMLGPSSSHTAGAVRLGRTARRIFGCLPEAVEFILYGSFAQTYQGHGTDLALAAGVLDCETDDPRIRDAISLATDTGMQISYRTSMKPAPHPNTVLMVLRDVDREDRILGASTGGGNIEILGVNGFDVKFSAAFPTLLLFHDDRPGFLARVTGLLGSKDMNIGYMDLDRKSRSGDALTVIEVDEEVSDVLLQLLREIPSVHRVCLIELKGAEEK
jgi:L-serine dehydratase